MFGRSNPAWLAFGGSLALLAVMVGLLYWLAAPTVDPARRPVVVYCAASMKEAMGQVAEAYRQECGRRVDLEPDMSEHLLARLEASGEGDLFLPADESYVRQAQDKGLVTEILPLARMRAVVLVGPGNPEHVNSWDDLLRPDVRVGLANEGAAVGKLTREHLERIGKWEALAGKRPAPDRLGMVTQVANAVELAAVDAGVVWDAVAFQHPRLVTVRLPELDGVTARVEVAVCKASKQPAEALRFARYVAARDRGLATLKQNGFPDVEDGEPWGEPAGTAAGGRP
jgi:molybdenum ABC transporter molybdate-binding protein